MDRVKYIVVNLDIQEDQESWTAMTFGPFNEYDDAVDYGNRWMQYFGVNELNTPMRDE